MRILAKVKEQVPAILKVVGLGARAVGGLRGLHAQGVHQVRPTGKESRTTATCHALSDQGERMSAKTRAKIGSNDREIEGKRR